MNLPIIDKEFLRKRVEETERIGADPMTFALEKLKKAKKEKADPFTIKKLEQNFQREGAIMAKILAKDPFLVKILSDDTEMDKFLSSKS